MLPTIRIGDKDVTRLICGGNPISGISHFSHEMDWDMLRYYTMPRLMDLLDECVRQGINTLQTRGDFHTMRMYLEYCERGGKIQWLVQTASEYRDLHANIDRMASFGPIAMYHHGTHTDNSWHTGKMDGVRDYVKAIKDLGLPAGIGTHIPDVVRYAEDKGWETDFYMCCFYDLARGYKSAPATARDAYAKDRFPAEDPPRMAAVMRSVRKPCLGFKFLAASRNCKSPEDTRKAFEFALKNIKPTDAIVAGMFPKRRDQAAENARYVREILGV